LLDGELDVKNSAEVQAHLAECPACQRRYEAQQSMSSNLRRTSLAYAAPDALLQRITLAVNTEALGVEADDLPSGAAGAGADAVGSGARVGAGVDAGADAGADAGTGVGSGARADFGAVGAVTSLGTSAANGGSGPGSAVSDAVANEPTFARGAADRHAARPRSGASRWLLLAGWPVALAASALLATVLLQQRTVEADDVVATHVRSLLVDHLNDVISTDHHTVKPWFAGKINFSPPVPDLTARGFELIGGRLDYLQHQPAAAVVYRKHGHIINVLSTLPGSELDKLPHLQRVQGYTLRSWHQGGLDVVAISDIDPRELVNLQQGYETPPPQTPD